MNALRATCVICGELHDLETGETWFFVGGPQSCVNLCSRNCFLEYAKRLQAPARRAMPGVAEGNGDDPDRPQNS